MDTVVFESPLVAFDSEVEDVKDSARSPRAHKVGKLRRKGRLRGKKNTTDEFVFSSKKQFGYKKADRIIRFSSEEGDHLKLDSDAFPDIKKIRFRASKSLRHFNKQQKKKSTIIYFEPTGELYFDQNGKQPGFGEAKESGLFAILKGAPEITSQDLSLL